MAIKSVVIITQDYYPLVGGITTWCHEIGRSLQAMGFEVTVITRTFGQESATENNSLNVIRLDGHRWKNRKYGLIRKAMKPFLSGETVFLCANWKMSIPCLQYSLSRNIRYFVGVHGLDVLEGRRVNRLIERWTLHRASGVIAVSRYTAGLLEPFSVNPAALRVVNNGVDIRKFTQGPRDAAIEQRYGIVGSFRLLTVSRLARRKGVDFTIKALAELNNADIHYYIAGKGGMESEWKQLADDLGVADRVHFLGFVPDEHLREIYRSADLFAMPSRELPLDVEGFGITYLEAAACGIPSLGGKGSGAEDAIDDGQTGYLVEPTSSSAIAKAMETLYNNPDLRQQMGQRARRRVEQSFTWEHVVSQIVDFMHERGQDQ